MEFILFCRIWYIKYIFVSTCSKCMCGKVRGCCCETANDLRIIIYYFSSRNGIKMTVQPFLGSAACNGI